MDSSGGNVGKGLGDRVRSGPADAAHPLPARKVPRSNSRVKWWLEIEQQEPYQKSIFGLVRLSFRKFPEDAFEAVALTVHVPRAKDHGRVIDGTRVSSYGECNPTVLAIYEMEARVSAPRSRCR